MKTLRDNNNNNNNSSSNTSSGHSSVLNRSNPSDINSGFQSTSNILKDQQGSYSIGNHFSKYHSSAIPTGYNPYSPLFNPDINQFAASIQNYLNNPQKLQPTEMINPLVYLQFLNANATFMQQLAALQTAINPPISFSQSAIDPNSTSIPYAAKGRPISQEELAEHARSIYQRALQRNQLQQQNDLMRHFYDSVYPKYQDLPTVHASSMARSHHSNNSYHDVPSVPNVSHIASAGTFDVLDTMIRSNASPSSCLSMKEQSLETVVSSLSLLSADDTKIVSSKSSTLDPSAPIFIPRHNGTSFDEDQETSSSSSDSDFNDFHYLDQFLDEFYPSDRQEDNHLILNKTLIRTNHSDSLGQGDNNDCSKEQSSSQYSIYQLLNRYRNPRSHLVLPEWSRLALILPNVCSMRAHTYKIKRYFAYRRRLCEDQEIRPDLSSESKELGTTIETNVLVEV